MKKFYNCRMFKKRILQIVFVLLSALGFSKELDGIDLVTVNNVLESNLFVNEYETLDEKMAYIDEVEKNFKKNFSEISDEAKFLCTMILKMHRAGVQKKELEKIEKENLNSSSKNQNASIKQKSKKEKKAEEERFVKECFSEYKNFMETHKSDEDFSAHFYYHFKEAELATLPFLLPAEQLSVIKTIMPDYKKIEEKNPTYGENLFVYGTVLCMMPKVAGGDKELGIEKIRLATEVSNTNYEKITSMIFLSQFLFEGKKYDESKEILQKALTQFPKNQELQNLQKMNDAGFSMFHINEYERKKGKNN